MPADTKSDDFYLVRESWKSALTFSVEGVEQSLTWREICAYIMLTLPPDRGYNKFLLEDLIDHLAVYGWAQRHNITNISILKDSGIMVNYDGNF